MFLWFLGTALVSVYFVFTDPRFDYRLLRAYTPILWVVSVIGLVVVLSPIGTALNGAQAWTQPIFLDGRP